MENFTQKLKTIRLARQDRGMTLEEVAILLPLRHGRPRSRQFLHRIETGKSARVDREIAEALSRILGLTLEEMFANK